MSVTYLGIDLGTTNSVAVLSDGERAAPVRTSDGGILLPSVVRIDGRANVTVGSRARRFLETDPENTRGEFKRLMGSGRKLSFRANKSEKSPEELSALVLSALRADAERALGFAPTAAVITVPALFELPQIRATGEAARLAGFERVEHLQEPVASALTAGWKRDETPAPWLVYDLGGGTFDVSMLETREGVLRVVDHDGDNFLGGRDMDARLLDFVLGRLGEMHGRPFRRADPALATMLRKLRVACEDAKIELGAARGGAVSLAEPLLAFGEEILVDVAIEADEFERLVLPIVDRSVEVCERLLARQGLAPRQLGHVVLVGGPTVMPLLRRRLEERLGVSLLTDIDPMTAVAEGAALFAAEHDLSTRGPAPSPAPGASASKATAQTPGGSRVWLQYPSVSGDLYPFVVGRLEDKSIVSVRALREGGGFESAREKVDEDGSFVAQLELRPRSASKFRLSGFDASGNERALEPGELTMRHGLSLADPPLSRTIGIALADGTVAVYFERGAPLPSRKTFRLRTVLSVSPGQQVNALSVPIVQGEVTFAHLCRLVGTIEVRADAITSVLPAGSPIDVVLELDRGGKLSATAHIVDRGVSFPGTLNLVSPDAPLKELELQLGHLRAKTEELYTDASVDAAARPKLVSADSLLDIATSELEAASGGDADALEKLRRLLIDVDASLADVEATKTWPDLDQRAMDVIGWVSNWVSRTGTDVERRTLDEAVRSLQRARATKSAADFGKRLRTIEQLGNSAATRDPDVVARWFRDLSTRVAESRDPRAAARIVSEGEQALRRGDQERVRQLAFSLANLLPPDEEDRLRAHGSGVER
ncbi:Hsp70 family protein [Labilithrix luteola]|nr:Hsp70 family protein [Labilithrix luteola]